MNFGCMFTGLKHFAVEVIVTRNQLRLSDVSSLEGSGRFVSEILPQSTLNCLCLSSRQLELFPVSFQDVK